MLSVVCVQYVYWEIASTEIVHLGCVWAILDVLEGGYVGTYYADVSAYSVKFAGWFGI